MNTTKLNANKKLICDITNNLYQIEGLDEEHIYLSLIAIMENLKIIEGGEDEEIVEDFVNKCNRMDVTLDIITNLFEEVFNKEENTFDDTFDDTFNQGVPSSMTETFDILNSYFGFQK